MPAAVMSSMTLSVTDDDAAPMTAEAPSAMSFETDCEAIWAFAVSDESVWMTVTGAPFTPPASLISLSARSTPATSGGPRKASEPVSGSRVPMMRPSLEPPPLPPGADDAPGSSVVDEQAARAKAATALTAPKRAMVFHRAMCISLHVGIVCRQTAPRTFPVALGDTVIGNRYV